MARKRKHLRWLPRKVYEDENVKRLFGDPKKSRSPTRSKPKLSKSNQIVLFDDVINPSSGVKRCNSCGKLLSLLEFNKDDSNDGFEESCRVCSVGVKYG